MLPQFSAQEVTLRLIVELERRRSELVADEALTRKTVGDALAELRSEYAEAELPPAYFQRLEQKLEETLPERWRLVAAPYTERERRDFHLWRGGDVVARLSYVFLGLALGGLCVELPFIPIWEKWFPFALALAAWWLPDAQVRFHQRHYARRLGAIARQAAALQPQLEATVTVESLLGNGQESHE